MLLNTARQGALTARHAVKFCRGRKPADTSWTVEYETAATARLNRRTHGPEAARQAERKAERGTRAERKCAVFGSATGLDAAAAAAAATAAAAAAATAAGLDIRGPKPHQAIVLDDAPLVHHEPHVLALARCLVDHRTVIAASTILLTRQLVECDACPVPLKHHRRRGAALSSRWRVTRPRTGGSAACGTACAGSSSRRRQAGCPRGLGPAAASRRAAAR
eukprot:scaffold45843_cov63-Phaeocystis_antarctica.AAC.2